MLSDIMKKEKKLVIGLMSGTSADGVDAVLVEITGHGINTRVRQLAFVSPPYTQEVRERILRIAAGDFGGSKELCLMNVLLGELFADACEMLCKEAGVALSDIMFRSPRNTSDDPSAPPTRSASLPFLWSGSARSRFRIFVSAIWPPEALALRLFPTPNTFSTVIHPATSVFRTSAASAISRCFLRAVNSRT